MSQSYIPLKVINSHTYVDPDLSDNESEPSFISHCLDAVFTGNEGKVMNAVNNIYVMYTTEVYIIHFIYHKN